MKSGCAQNFTFHHERLSLAVWRLWVSYGLFILCSSLFVCTRARVRARTHTHSFFGIICCVIFNWATFQWHRWLNSLKWHNLGRKLSFSTCLPILAKWLPAWKWNCMMGWVWKDELRLRSVCVRALWEANINAERKKKKMGQTVSFKGI